MPAIIPLSRRQHGRGRLDADYRFLPCTLISAFEAAADERIIDRVSTMKPIRLR